MKNIIINGIFLIILSCLLISCNKELKQNKENIIGSWVQLEPTCSNLCDTLHIDTKTILSVRGGIIEYDLLTKDEILLKDDNITLTYSFGEGNMKLTLFNYYKSLIDNKNQDLLLRKIN